MTTRDRIIVAAMRLFAEKGYQSTSVADILAAAHANAGSLYHAFPTKQDVLLAVLQAYRDGIGEMLLAPAWGDVADPVEQVFALLAAYRQMLVGTDCLYGCPIGSLALELHEPDPPVRALLAANFDAWKAAVRGRVEAAGPRLAGADAEQLATFVLTVMEGAVMQARTHRTIAVYDACVASLRDYFQRLEQGG